MAEHGRARAARVAEDERCDQERAFRPDRVEDGLHGVELRAQIVLRREHRQHRRVRHDHHGIGNAEQHVRADEIEHLDRSGAVPKAHRRPEHEV